MKDQKLGGYVKESGDLGLFETLLLVDWLIWWKDEYTRRHG